MVELRKTLATYLESRTQSEYSPQPINQHKLRKPDMSQQAADIFKATVNDVAAGIPPPYEFNGKGDTEMMNGNAPPSPVKRQSSLSSLSSLNTVQNLSGWAQLEDMLRQGASTAAREYPADIRHKHVMRLRRRSSATTCASFEIFATRLPV